MEYTKPFEIEFIARTLKIVEQYDQFVLPNQDVTGSEQFEVTLLINCLLGLLVLPKQNHFDKIPPEPVSRLGEWGLDAKFILDWGRCPRCRRDNEAGNLRDVVHRMRNSVAHLRVVPRGNGHEITELELRDENGFHAVVPCDNLKVFVAKLARAVCG